MIDELKSLELAQIEQTALRVNKTCFFLPKNALALFLFLLQIGVHCFRISVGPVCFLSLGHPIIIAKATDHELSSQFWTLCKNLNLFNKKVFNL